MEDPVNWYAGACLCLRSGVKGKKAEELFRGQIAEVIHAAMQRPEHERLRLFICCEAVNHRLSWAKVVKLAARADFPVMV